VEEVRIHSGTRVKLKHVEENALPREFVLRLKEYAHKEERIQAVYFFAIEPGEQPEQPSIAVALRSGFFSKVDDAFLQIVDEIQLMLPEDLSVNLYRFGASDFLASYCTQSLEPIYLRSQAWLIKQSKKYLKK
jgi:hypothetical protein